MASSFELPVVRVSIKDPNGNSADAVFSNLSVFQTLADVCSFSFQLHPSREDRAVSSYVDFLKKCIGMDVTITIRDTYTFLGIIQTVQASADLNGIIVYDISGQGQYARVNEIPQCKTFEAKNLETIFKALLPEIGCRLATGPKHTDAIAYMVQYNQTVFECYRMMAARYGEWLWYDGSTLHLAPPPEGDGATVPVTVSKDIHQMRMSATTRHAQASFTGFNYTKGEALSATQQPDNTRLDAAASAAMDAGANVYGHDHTPHHLPQAANADQLKRVAGSMQHFASASTVSMTAYSHDARLNICKTIAVSDVQDHSLGSFVITAITHTASDANNYTNYFSAVPATVAVPPYTDVYSYLNCQPMVAVVTDNVNDSESGVDRLRVHFPWQEENAKSPWIPVAVPHAGKNKGFRFLPEIGDEVLVDFINGNPERPFVVGAIHTDNNGSGVDNKGNNQKIIGTRTGRQFRINDESGVISMQDNFVGEFPIGIVQMHRDDSTNSVIVVSEVSEGNSARIQMVKDETLALGLMQGDEAIAVIEFSKDGKRISIKADGSISLAAGEINLDAKNININASGDLLLSAGQKVTIESGTEIEGTAGTEVALTAGTNATLQGGAQAKVSGGAMTEIQGALVKIN